MGDKKLILEKFENTCCFQINGLIVHSSPGMSVQSRSTVVVIYWKAGTFRQRVI